MTDPAAPSLAPALVQVNLLVRDLDASVAFYRRLGVEVDLATEPGWEEHHATVTMPGGVRLEIDTKASATAWNPGARPPETGGGVVLFFAVATRADVDRVCFDLTAAGHAERQPPTDGFWGARYAIVEDPDGNPVGLTSPVERALRRPAPPPED